MGQPIGTRVVRFKVSDNQVRSGTVDLGRIEVEASLGPQPGELVADFAFQTPEKTSTRLTEFRGQYVLLDFWATWRAPCVAKLPIVKTIHEKYQSDDSLIVIGLNLDQDRDLAK